MHQDPTHRIHFLAAIAITLSFVIGCGPGRRDGGRTFPPPTPTSSPGGSGVGAGGNGANGGSGLGVGGGDYRWSEGFGDTSDQVGTAVAVDAGGYVFVAGYFKGSVNFGSGALTSAGGDDAFLAKFTADGQLSWGQSFGNSSNQNINGIALDSTGNIWVAGETAGDVDFGCGTLSIGGGARDVFVVQFDTGGACLQHFGFGGSDNEYCSSIAVDDSNNVIITGYFPNDEIDFGGGAVSAGAYVAAFNSDTDHIWSDSYGNGDDGYLASQSVAVDSQRNVTITGTFSSNPDFGGGQVSGSGVIGVFVASFGPTGAHRWSKGFGTGGQNFAEAVATDSSDNVVITGAFDSNINFGGDQLASVGDRDVFVAKFDSDGAHVFSQRHGDQKRQTAAAVACDDADNVIFTGNLDGSMSFGGPTVDGVGGGDLFVTKLNSSAAYRWAQSFGDTDLQEGLAVATGPGGKVFVTGKFEGELDFGSDTLTSAGSTDIFVVSFDP